MELKGNKLLILGGHALMTDIVLKAKEMGIYTIVSDWNDIERSPAKKISDEHWMVSITDIEQLASLVEKNNISGIFTNYTDSYLPHYVKLCEKTGLPCLANIKQIETISNKDLSKRICIKHGISVSKKYNISTIEEIDNLKIKFPVLTKPVDNSGQRGIFVCKDKVSLKEKYAESLKFSPSKKIIIEEYVEGDYTVMFYTIQNGQVTLSTMADKPVYGSFENNLPKLPLGYLLPSKYLNICKQKMLPKMQSLVSDLGISNGVIGVEAVVQNNEIFVFEMQFRLGGMKHHNFVQAENGVDLLKMLIGFTFTGKLEGWDMKIYDNPYFKNVYCSLNILIRPESIKKITGLDKVLKMKEVYAYTQMIHIGDCVNLPGTVQQIAFKFSLKGKSNEQIIESIEKIYSELKIENNQGDNIIIKVDSNVFKNESAN